MTTDELTSPLGQNRPARRRRFRLPITVSQAIGVLLGLFLLAFAAVAIFHDDPLGGQPIASVTLRPPVASAPPPATPATTAAPQSAPAPAAKSAEGQRTITIIDGSSGARRDVVVSGDGALPDGGGPEAGAPVAKGVNPRLLEKTRYGMIPVAADGLKPFRAYATGTDADRSRAATMPVVSIVVTGLGLGSGRTGEAITRLPGPAALAFTPYGSEPAKLAEQARAAGHEILLQIPMEPFDYPDNDPGPQTLLTTQPAEQNIERLHWHLSRIQGYVGIVNFMGARFVANDAALQPIMQDAARRGLGFLDDGTASRSLTGQTAQAQAMPFARVDLTIDTVPTAADIDRALAKLESLARDKGAAIAVASALPVSLERVAAWAKSLESRGIALVPLTVAMEKARR